MSLFRQIALVVVFFQIITLGAVIYQNFHSVHEQVKDRLFSDAKDTATSLGLSISVATQSTEPDSRVKTMINAIFDSGYYRAIVLKDVDGEVLYEKLNPNVVYSVPQWFVEYVSLENVVAQSEIMSGWKRFGVISIYSHNGHAYLQLWEILNNLFKWFLIIGFGATITLYFLLGFIFKPLKKVQSQAEGILHNEFLKNSEEPFTTELKDVTLAMNSMVVKAQEVFKREVEAVKKYRDVLCFDQEFKVANRYHFMNLLKGHLNEKDDSSFGVVLIVKFLRMDRMKKSGLGYDAFFNYFQELIRLMNSVASSYSSSAVVARFSVTSYALLLPGRETRKEMDSIAKRLLEEMERLSSSVENAKRDSSFSIGVTRYAADMSIKTIMTHVDYALLQANLSKESSYCVYHEKSELEDLMTLGREVWVKKISEAITHHRFEFVSHACLNVQDKSLYHKEIYTKMRLEDGKLLSADFFLPIAKYASLLKELDIYLLKKIIENNLKRVALNISIDSVGDNAFLSLVQEFALSSAIERKRPYIHFEINLNSIGSNVNAVAEFSKKMKRLGCAFGINHFMFSSNTLNLIETIAPSYVKVGVEHFIHYSQDDTFDMMQSIHNVTSTYNVDIIAVNVENEEDKNLLNKIDVQLMQGRYVEDTQPLVKSLR